MKPSLSTSCGNLNLASRPYTASDCQLATSNQNPPYRREADPFSLPVWNARHDNTDRSKVSTGLPIINSVFDDTRASLTETAIKELSAERKAVTTEELCTSNRK